MAAPTGQHRTAFDSSIPLVAGDFALSGGFGSTASVGTITGNDNNCRFVITSAGSGQGANPTCVITFKTPFVNVPAVVACRGGGSQPLILITVTAVTATSVTLTFNGTPVAAETYTVSLISSDC